MIKANALSVDDSPLQVCHSILSDNVVNIRSWCGHWPGKARDDFADRAILRRAKFVNLSDGGHFDNTAVYEMLKRRCGHILLIDADTTLSGMTNLSMRARVDLDTTLERTKSSADQPWEEYAIHYPQLNGDPQFSGTLVRVFPKVCEAAWCGDRAHYAARSWWVLKSYRKITSP